VDVLDCQDVRRWESFTAGSYTFTAVNNGKIVHALEIDGPGGYDC
jgi:hypothetical protein